MIGPSSIFHLETIEVLMTSTLSIEAKRVLKSEEGRKIEISNICSFQTSLESVYFLKQCL